MLTIRHVCDLPCGVLRVLNVCKGILTVETIAQRQLRVAIIDTASGHVCWTKTRLPILAPSRCGYSGERWLRIHNVRKGDGGQSADLTWQDEVDGCIWRVVLPDDKARVAVCPPDTRLAFVGTMQNWLSGDGAVYALEQGVIKWTFRPPHTESIPISDEQSRQVKAYPHRMACSPDGSLTAFTFLRYFYLLSAEGRLVRVNDTAELFRNDPNIVVRPHRRRQSSSSWVGDFVVTTEIDRGPSYPFPAFDDVSASPDGKVIVAAAANMLVWFTRSGEVAHALQIDTGRNYLGNPRPISHILVSAEGRTVFAFVREFGTMLIRDGLMSKHILGQARCPERSQAAMDTANRRIALADGNAVCILDFGGRGLAQIKVDGFVGGIHWANGGQFVIISGANNRVYEVLNG